jgi:hypothetical protein
MPLPDLSSFNTTKLPTLTRPRLRVSFSGGRTSALMTALLVQEYRDRRGHEVLVTFANTGQEHPETLVFVDKCDREWGLGVVWLEADIHPRKGAGTRARVVTFETASRDGRPYEDFCAKYGIPNKNRIWCTRELKEYPMDRYVTKTLKWKRGSFHTAIGIRADEMDRVSINALDKGFTYPLVDLGVRKDDVLAWFRQQPFDLRIQEHWGNCTWCWKKSDRKLFTLAKEAPEIFDFPARMEQRYGEVGYNNGKQQVFFRLGRSTAQVLEAARLYDGPLFTDMNWQPDNRDGLDIGSACGESCEIGADED